MSKILIVDDNKDVLQLMQLLLSSRGYDVSVTAKAEETFQLVTSIQPNLIFLDIQLSGADGREISRQLKTTEEYRHIPIILFSANVIKGATLKESMADDFIAKPFDIHELLLKVIKFTGGLDSANSMIA